MKLRTASSMLPHASLLLLMGALPASAAETLLNGTAPATTPAVKQVEIAICLDTSGSMQGLIDAARAKLWEIVNDLSTATPTPSIHVALLSYGNDGLAPESGWTNVEIGLTGDLDTVSAKLFALSTNGGYEYVGRVIDRATRDLHWTPGAEALKIMIVAGNESADQDQQVHFQDACKRAVDAGVLVNSIYCGPATDDLVARWQEVAQLAEGKSACIDHNGGTVMVRTPFDDELSALSTALNATYLPFGAQGELSARNQSEQDRNAAGLGSSVAAQRCATKSGSAYCNAEWDLVDASASASFRLESVPEQSLPEWMRSLTLDQRRAVICQRSAERAIIQSKVKELDGQRARFVAETLAKSGGDGASFDRAIRNAVRQQASARGLSFPDDTAAPAAIAHPAPQPVVKPIAAPPGMAAASKDGC